MANNNNNNKNNNNNNNNNQNSVFMNIKLYESTHKLILFFITSTLSVFKIGRLFKFQCFGRLPVGVEYLKFTIELIESTALFI